MKNKALPGNLERMNKFKIMNITHIIKAFFRWLHSVMKQSPATTLIQNVILPVWLQMDKT